MTIDSTALPAVGSVWVDRKGRLRRVFEVNVHPNNQATFWVGWVSIRMIDTGRSSVIDLSNLLDRRSYKPFYFATAPPCPVHPTKESK